MRKKIVKNYENLRNHIVDTTALTAICNPLLSISENVLMGLSDSTSISNRINGSIIFYLGAGSAFSKGRDLYNNIFNVKEDSKYKILHESIWGTLFGAGINSVITAVNSPNLEDVVSGGIAGAIIGSVTGFPSGYFIDLYRDLTGITSSERMPEKIKDLSKSVKIGIATGLMVASIASMTAIYYTTPDNFQGLSNYLTPFINNVNQKL